MGPQHFSRQEAPRHGLLQDTVIGLTSPKFEFKHLTLVTWAPVSKVEIVSETKSQVRMHK